MNVYLVTGQIATGKSYFTNIISKKGYKFFLSNNTKLAINLNLDGAYIPSFNKELNHLSFSIKKKMTV